MLSEPHRIRIESDSELARLLEKVGDTPVLLEKNGKFYRLTEEKEEDLWAGYDPEKAREALKKAAGSWADIDACRYLSRPRRGFSANYSTLMQYLLDTDWAIDVLATLRGGGKSDGTRTTPVS